MATHSSVLAWRIPGTAEPGGLLSTGSHRVGCYNFLDQKLHVILGRVGERFRQLSWFLGQEYVLMLVQWNPFSFSVVSSGGCLSILILGLLWRTLDLGHLFLLSFHHWATGLASLIVFSRLPPTVLGTSRPFLSSPQKQHPDLAGLTPVLSVSLPGQGRAGVGLFSCGWTSRCFCVQHH